MSVRGPPYLCSDCKIEYSVYSSYRSHVLMKHTTPNKKCSYCDTKFHTNATLNAHMYKCMHTTTHNTQNEMTHVIRNTNRPKSVEIKNMAVTHKKPEEIVEETWKRSK